MARQWQVVASFGGGLNYSVNPAAIEDSQWGRALNFFPDEGSAVTAPTYDMVIAANMPYSPAQTTIGILPNPFDIVFPLLIFNSEAGKVHLWKSRAVKGHTAIVNTDTTEIPWDGAGTRATYGGGNSAVQSTVLNGWLVFTVGQGMTTPAGFSMGQWNGVGNW